MNNNRLVKKLIKRKDTLTLDIYNIQTNSNEKKDIISRLQEELDYVEKSNGKLLRKIALRAMILKYVRSQTIIDSNEYMKYLKIIERLVKKVDPGNDFRMLDRIGEYKDNNRYALNIFSGSL